MSYPGSMTNSDYPWEPPLAGSEAEHVIGALSKGRVLDGLEFPIPPLQHPSNDRLGRQKAFAQLALKLSRNEQRAQQLAVRPKDARECGVEFPFNALGILIQLGQRLLERVPQADQLFFDVVLADGRGRPIPVEGVADNPGRRADTEQAAAGAGRARADRGAAADAGRRGVAVALD